ncbi:glycoside hydrolase [Corynascus novoguineensis]|uniref:Endo-chitosanase n=1 Tax=Corynascus novoguineensis TaxID=1126955 RepID=A0AAN7CU87_9PEZI|nr:glycoside hydrolase [Corynascus novoguineensis]
MRNHVLLSALAGAASVTARDIPSNVQSFYNSLKTKGNCSNKLATGFYANDDGPNTFAYCGDHVSDYNVIYIQGSKGEFADMDVDCDGEQNGRGDDGRCGSSDDTQSITSFQYIVESYGKGINDLNAYVHPYVVFGNEGTKSGWKTFDPEKYGIKPLSVMAVVCNGKLIYGIWGDENGDDGDTPMVGEASISLATACFGTSMTGNNGHDETDVLYLAFPGNDAVPGANGANWDAESWQDFESSIEELGNKLIQRVGGEGGSGGGGDDGDDDDTDPGNGDETGYECEWAGHCEGANCTVTVSNNYPSVAAAAMGAVAEPPQAQKQAPWQLFMKLLWNPVPSQ